MTPQEIEALFGPQTPAPASPSAPPAAAPEMSPEQLFGPDTSAAPASPAAPTPEQPGMMSRVAGDIGTGVTELPRAVAKGTRDALNETAGFVSDVSGWQSKVLDPVWNLFGGGPTPDVQRPQLPEIDAPKSVTGKLASSVSQFIVGMVGLGKVAKPLEAATGLANARRAAKIGAEMGKAATVGAVAFDPTADRISNIVESVPGLSNPFTRFMMAQPGDSRAEGRMKNALESLGMDTVLVGGIMAGSKAFRAVQDWRAGKITADEMHKAVAQAEKANTPREQADELGARNIAKAEAEWKAGGGEGPVPEWVTQDARVDAKHEVAQGLGARQTGDSQSPTESLTDPFWGKPDHSKASANNNLPAKGERAILDTLPSSADMEGFNKAIYRIEDAPVDPEAILKVFPEGEHKEAARRLVAEGGIAEEFVDLWHKAYPQADGLLSHSSHAGDTSEAGRAVAEGLVPGAERRLDMVLDAANDRGPSPKAAETSTVLSVERVDTLPADAPPAPRFTELSDEQVAGIVASTKSDADAFVSAGGWDAAVSEGHVFGRGERIPWQRLLAKQDVPSGGEAPQLPLSAFMARVADGIEKEINKARGGNADGVLTDRMADFAWRSRVEAWGDNPSEVIGLISQAGKSSRTALANYEAGLALGFKATQDAYAAAARIRAGDLSAWGGDEAAAHQALKDMLQVVATINGSTEALKASAGRILRRTRTEFALSPEDLRHIQGLDGEQLAKSLEVAGGDPRLLKKLAHPSMLERLQDTSQWLLVNNLLWGLKTHAVNLMTNAYMGFARPMERIIGSRWVGGTEGAVMRSQAWRQYLYMGQSLIDGFQSTARAWQAGDSILTPHRVEYNQQGINSAAIPFKEPANVSDILHNIGVAGIKTLGLPTRALGTIDELNKQVVYRSIVSAQAHVEGAAQGLAGAALKAHVQKAVLDAFDGAGRGVNLSAVQEAKIATFSQDLLPKTLGSGIQHLAQNVPLVKIIVPFVKTPTNVLRYGQKMTPGLNLLQTEYRQMLTGKLGPEAQAQAVGQMSLGSLYLGAAAWLATSGFITGGGPSDPKKRQLWLQSGAQPYAFVSLDEKGNKRYVSFGKYDPIAMPLGIVADMVDASGNWDDEESFMANLGEVGTAMLMAIAKQLSQKSYLTSINMTFDALMDPDRSMGRAAGQTALNFVPAASLLRNTTQMFFDDHMRDARSMADRVLAITPGLSDKVPPKRDVWGDPVSVSKGLWVTNEKDAVDAEVRRMIAEEDASFGTTPYILGGVDLRDVQMVNGKNAYDQYQDWVGRPSPGATPLKETVAKIVRTAAYKKAPDGDAGTRGTKQWIISGTISKYRDMAGRRMRGDKNVREAMLEKQRDVAKAYAASKAPQTPEQTGRGTISNIGRAFGVDLDGLMQR